METLQITILLKFQRIIVSFVFFQFLYIVNFESIYPILKLQLFNSFDLL